MKNAAHHDGASARFRFRLGVGWLTLLPLWHGTIGHAGSVEADFNKGIADGFVVRGSAEWLKSGGLNGSPFVSLTPAKAAQQGSLVLPELDRGQTVESFTVGFQLRMGGGTVPPADGFSLNFASDLPELFGEEGGGSGLTIAFDTFNNGCGEAPAIEVRYQGKTVASRKFGVGEMNTGTNLVPVFIAVDASGRLNLAYAGKVVFANLMAYLPTRGQFGFGARTGALTDQHGIDDLSVATAPASGPYAIEVRPWLEPANADSTILVRLQDNNQKVVASSLRLQLDGASVAATASRSNGVTTVTYTPPHESQRGSSHSAGLTYQDTASPPVTHTITWDFSVALLSRGTFFVEAEDYNYLGGQYLADSGSGPYDGGAYAGLGAFEGIDLHVAVSGTRNDYQRDSSRWPGTAAWGCDPNRGDFIVGRDFKLESNDPGEWYNYTRIFPKGDVWNVYGRFAAAGENAFASLDEVVSGSTSFSQSLNALGTFFVPAAASADEAVLVPLLDAKGEVARIRFDGERTFRFSIQDGHQDANYFAFVPAAPQRLSQFPPAGLSLLGTQLSIGDNTLNEVIKGVPVGSTVYLFNAASNRFVSSVLLSGGKWVPNLPVPPGTGLFIDLPQAQEIVFEGQPLSGNLQLPLVKGFNLVASKWLQAGPLEHVLQYPPVGGDIVFKFGVGGYDAFVFDADFGWETEPTINFGEGFWIKTDVSRVWQQDVPGDGNLFSRSRSKTPVGARTNARARLGVTAEFANGAAVSGTVQFCNVWPNHQYPVGKEYFAGGLSDQYRAQLWIGTNAAQLKPVDVLNQSPIDFDGRGEFNGGPVELPAVEPGKEVFVQIRTWHRTYADYETADRAPQAVIFESPVFRAQTIGGGSPPTVGAYLTNLLGFKVRPLVEWEVPLSLVYGQRLGDFAPPTVRPPGDLSPRVVDGAIVFEGDDGIPPAGGGDPPAAGPMSFTAVFMPTDTDTYLEARRQVTLTVTKAPLTVTANNANRAYGATDPDFTVRFDGLVNQETEQVISGTAVLTPGASAASPVGSYLIVPALGTLRADNYAFDRFINGTLDVRKAPLTVTAFDVARRFGEPNPAFGGTITGLRNNDPVSLNNTCNATATSPPGTYPIIAGLLDANGRLGNYEVTLDNGTLTILPGDTRILPPAFVGGVFIVPVTTFSGFSYTLEYLDSLAGFQWEQGQTLPGTGGTVILSDSAGAATARYYRVRVEAGANGQNRPGFEGGAARPVGHPDNRRSEGPETPARLSANSLGIAEWLTGGTDPGSQLPLGTGLEIATEPIRFPHSPAGAQHLQPSRAKLDP